LTESCLHAHAGGGGDLVRIASRRNDKNATIIHDDGPMRVRSSYELRFVRRNATAALGDVLFARAAAMKSGREDAVPWP